MLEKDTGFGRMHLILDALEKDPKISAEDVLERVNRALLPHEIKKGLIAELRVQKLLAGHPLVKSARLGTKKEDRRQIDLVINLKDLNYPKVLVQVKSSVVNAEKAKKQFLLEERKIIVLTAGERFSDQSILQSFDYQLGAFYDIFDK